MSFLRFGIPSLDRIINNVKDDPYGIPIACNQSTSISIIGPDGTGKSVLALHIAAHYLFDQRLSSPPPIVLCVSTDSSYSMAHDRTWKPFSLDNPGHRAVPFDDNPRKEMGSCGINEKIDLVRLRPLGYEKPLVGKNNEWAVAGVTTVAGFLRRESAQQKENLQVGFVDLAANSAGDDWGFVNRVLASLPAPGAGGAVHLLILTRWRASRRWWATLMHTDTIRPDGIVSPN